jgi:NAD(P)-dependent dehydrogenase (short-subunit alcohol dehydrogenase family)
MKSSRGKSLRDKVVLVTGASSGIGEATALRLAEHGSQLALVSRNQAALELVGRQCAERGARHLVLPTDVAESDQCRRAIEQTVATYGRLDIVINCAGLSMRAYFDGSDLAAMERVMRVNFFGTLYMTHFALPHVQRTKGSLVAVSSMVGKRATPAYALYGASKFAIHGFYEALHIELKHDGVHVGVVAPAFVDTPLRLRALGADGQPAVERPPDQFRVWPVGKCVDCIIDVIVKRKREALLPWFAGPFLILDQILGRRLGDRMLDKRFPPELERK